MKIFSKFPFFSKHEKYVCRASQVMTEDGSNVEDKLKSIEGEGGSSGAVKFITIYGTGTYVSIDGNDAQKFNIIENPEENDNNYISKEDVDYISSNQNTLVIINVDGLNEGRYLGITGEQSDTYLNVFPLHSFDFAMIFIDLTENKLYVDWSTHIQDFDMSK